MFDEFTFTRIANGHYTGYNGRFAIQRIGTKDRPWHAVEITRTEQGENVRITLGQHRTLDAAKGECFAIVRRERAERGRQQAAEQVARREAQKAAEDAERIARQSAEPSAYNTDVLLDLRISKDEAIGLVSRMLENLKNGEDEVQLVIVTRTETTPVRNAEGGTDWVPTRYVAVQPGWSGFDTAKATIYDSRVEPSDVAVPVA